MWPQLKPSWASPLPQALSASQGPSPGLAYVQLLAPGEKSVSSWLRLGCFGRGPGPLLAAGARTEPSGGRRNAGARNAGRRSRSQPAAPEGPRTGDGPPPVGSPGRRHHVEPRPGLEWRGRRLLSPRRPAPRRASERPGGGGSSAAGGEAAQVPSPPVNPLPGRAGARRRRRRRRPGGGCLPGHHPQPRFSEGMGFAGLRRESRHRWGWAHPPWAGVAAPRPAPRRRVAAVVLGVKRVFSDFLPGPWRLHRATGRGACPVRAGCRPAPRLLSSRVPRGWSPLGRRAGRARVRLSGIDSGGQDSSGGGSQIEGNGSGCVSFCFPC